MELPAIEERLDAIDREERPVVVRFDEGEPFAGRIAVLPSAFNPPTLAHLHLLERARELEGISGAAAVLSTRNVSKRIVGARLADRVCMLLAAREEAPWLAVLAVNVPRLMDQGTALRDAYPDAGFDFLVGYDTLVRLFDRSYYDTMERDLQPFFEHHRVIAANRAGADIGRVERFIESEAGPYQRRILPLEIDEDVAWLSSTAAREAVASGMDPRQLPAPVAAYVRRRDLYRDWVSQ